jgi:hypothetical protein
MIGCCVCVAALRFQWEEPMPSYLPICLKTERESLKKKQPGWEPEE